MNLTEKIKKIVRIINKTYEKPAALRKTDPVDELVRTILSQNTNDLNSLAAFARLKESFGKWDDLLKVPAGKVRHIIRHAGLSKIKAGRIKAALGEIKNREGRISLTRLGDLDYKIAMEYLESLKGVGPKTASCVLLFSFGAPVMPVDTHIFRVSRRLGLISGKIDSNQAHEVLTKIVPKHLIYEFHLGIIMHGRKTCIAQGPRCGSCSLYRLCRFREKTFHRKKKLCRSEKPPSRM